MSEEKQLNNKAVEQFDSNTVSAAALDDCANRNTGRACRCKPKCARCGGGRHMVAHRLTIQEFDRAHEFVPSKG